MAAKKKAGAGTYEGAGVSIEEAERFVTRLTKRHPVIGGTAGAFPLDVAGMKKPVLMASTDGVGTKIILARECGALATIGIDLVAMVANDIAVTGARPLFFLDYYATGKLSAEEGATVLSGIEKGCEKARMDLIGGETAEMPGLYREGEFDLAGFGVGIAEKDDIVDGSGIRAGDVVLGVASSGVHSNGYSLVRSIVAKKKLSLAKKHAGLDDPLGEVLARPTRLYVRTIATLLEKVPVKGMAHITGGGIARNVGRIMPDGLCARIDTGAWEAPPIFAFLQNAGAVSDAEMRKVFNMGIGLIVIVREKHAKAATRALLDASGRTWRIGVVEKRKAGGEKVVY